MWRHCRYSCPSWLHHAAMSDNLFCAQKVVGAPWTERHLLCGVGCRQRSGETSQRLEAGQGQRSIVWWGGWGTVGQKSQGAGWDCGWVSFLSGLGSDRQELDLIGVMFISVVSSTVCGLISFLPSLELLAPVRKLLNFQMCGSGAWPCRVQGQLSFFWYSVLPKHLGLLSPGEIQQCPIRSVNSTSGG